MKELKDYTIEELKAEIKRRQEQKPSKRAGRPKAEYAELTGVVTHVSMPSVGCKAIDYHFRVKFNDEELKAVPRTTDLQNNFEYYHANSSIKRNNLPKEGDKVIVRSRTNDFFKPFSDSNSMIIKVIKDEGQH